MPQIAPERSISRSEFESLIAQGRKLIVLDDLVLDVERFIN